MKWNDYYADLVIPADWKDSCSGNDLLPSFTVVKSDCEYQIFIDSYDWEVRAVNTEDVTGSKSPLLPRFTVKRLLKDENVASCYRENLRLFEDFPAVLAFIDK